jgi:selenide, water dikinase
MVMEEKVRLTSFSHGAGCACKLGPGDLAEVMRRLNPALTRDDPDLLVGTATGDDAAVYRLDERTALVFTADFFTPIVDDPYDWGRVGAANALSDVYAMGGRPILALNLVAWPSELGPDLLARVLDGGASVALDAGVIVAGGHTIDDKEPKFGMAVVGLVDPSVVTTNAAARPGDVLVLTKPLGLGVLTTAIKRGLADDDQIASAVDTMTRLNRESSAAMVEAGVRAATDVTGFGLLGHLQKMMEHSGTEAELWAAEVPLLPGVRELVAAGAVAGGTRRNMAHVDAWVKWDDVGDEATRVLFADAQTSGGLLIGCPADRLERLHASLADRGEIGVEIGLVTAGPAGKIVVRPKR